MNGQNIETAAVKQGKAGIFNAGIIAGAKLPTYIITYITSNYSYCCHNYSTRRHSLKKAYNQAG